jgi:uncharacterized protein YybS (DUF2232 family)
MNRNSSVRALANTALATALSVIIAVIGLFVPVLSLASLVWPVPVIVVIKRYGFKYGVYSTVASGLIVGMISEPFYAAYVIFAFGALGLAIGYGVHKGYSAGKILTITAAASLVSKILLVYAVTRIMGVNPLETQFEAMRKGIEFSLEFYDNMGMEVPQGMRDTLLSSFELIRVTLPALLILASLLDSFLNYTAARIVLKRLGLNMEALPPFGEWRAPSNLSLGFLILMGLTLAGGYLGLEGIDIVMGNILVLFQMIFMVQGISVLYYFLTQKGVNRFIKVLVIVFVLFNQFLAMAAVFAGLLDVLLDFRKRFSKDGRG